MSKKVPRVSIGLAVFNGENFLEEAVDSILAQSFTDFELIISDNASTDRTAAICKAYAAKDSRIRYYRNPENIGGANNENQTFRLARGEYFRWAAHDDVCAPDLLEKCIAVLERDPEVILCTTQIREIDEKGNETRVVSRNLAASSQPYRRFRDLAFRRDHNCEATYGLIRADVLRKTRLQQNYTDSDRTLLCELALYGTFFEVASAHFSKRYHPKNKYVDWRARMAWFDTNAKGKISFPNWMQFFDLLITINRVQISPYSRLRCHLIMISWLLFHCRYLLKDLLVALTMITFIGKWKRSNENLYNWE